MDSVKCPHCGEQVELSEAIIHELQAQVRKEEEKKLKAQFEEQKAKEQAEHEKKLREEFEKENKQSSLDLEKAKKEKLELEEKLKKEQADKEKIEEKIRLDAKKNAEEEQRLKLKEKDLLLDQARKANEELKRKLEQGSQQMQGEVLELDLEEKLKAAFPTDEFVPVPKGVEGGDVWQKVRFNGKVVGSIIWETKRTKAWSNLWITKLKDDAGKISASESIIVSQTLPNGSASFDRKDGVWITTYEHALNICRYVRFLITTVSTIKSSASHTEEEWGQIRDYMMSDNFKHRMQSHFDNVNSLKQLLDAEKRSTQLKWKRQESVISKLDANSMSFYGELQSIVPSLPEIKGIDNILTDTDEKPLF